MISPVPSVGGPVCAVCALPRRAGRGCGETGFTLLEMLVVLAILGLVAALYALRGPAHSASLDVKQAAGMVAQAMRGARAAAIAADRPQVVTLDPAQRQIRADGSVRLLPAGITIAAVNPFGRPLPAHAVAIWFAPDGSASGANIVIAEGAISAEVGVDWLTGRVRLANAR